MKDSISNLFDYDLCIETRTITFFDEINEESASRFLKALHLLDNYEKGTITVLLTTEGGDVGAGLKMLDAVRLLKNPSRVICYAGVESMGTVLLQAFSERCMTPNSYLMIHSGESGAIGKSKDRAEWNRLLDYQEDVCLSEYLQKINDRQVLKKKKKHTKESLTKMLDFDKILLPKEAIALGLVDIIIEESY